MRDNVMAIKCGSDISFKDVTGKVVFQLSTDRYTMSLYPNQKIYAYTSNKKDAEKVLIGEIVASKNNSHKWGLKNLSKDVWTYKSIWGEKGSVRYDEVMSIARGCHINFGSMSGKITG
jgi:hypothetical protein